MKVSCKEANLCSDRMEKMKQKYQLRGGSNFRERRNLLWSLDIGMLANVSDKIFAFFQVDFFVSEGDYSPTH